VAFAVSASLLALALSVLLDLPSGATVAMLVALAGLLPTILGHGPRRRQHQAGADT
jgi:ABC-type Mn2+/Zn2+ transport system permease subunit